MDQIEENNENGICTLGAYPLLGNERAGYQ